MSREPIPVEVTTISNKRCTRQIIPENFKSIVDFTCWCEIQVFGNYTYTEKFDLCRQVVGPCTVPSNLDVDVKNDDLTEVFCRANITWKGAWDHRPLPFFESDWKLCENRVVRTIFLSPSHREPCALRIPSIPIMLGTPEVNYYY